MSLKRPKFGDGGTVLKEKEYRKELASYEDSRLRPLDSKRYTPTPESEKFMPTARALVPDPLVVKDKVATKPGSFGMAFSQARMKAKEDAIAKGLTDPADITKFVANQVFEYNGKSYLTAVKEEVAHLPKKVQEYVVAKKADGDLKKVQEKENQPAPVSSTRLFYDGSKNIGKAPEFMYGDGKPNAPTIVQKINNKVQEVNEAGKARKNGSVNFYFNPNTGRKASIENGWIVKDPKGNDRLVMRQEDGNFREPKDYEVSYANKTISKQTYDVLSGKVKATPRQVQIPSKESPESWLSANGFQKAFAKKVTDGDTYLSGNTSKRLGNLSAPESSQPNGTEAGDNLNRILASGGQLYEKKTGTSGKRDIVETVILKDGKIMALDSLGALTNPGLSALSSDNYGQPLYPNAGISYGSNESRMQRNARLLKQGAKAKGTKDKNQFGH